MHDLKLVYEALYGPLNGAGPDKAHCRDLARRLRVIAGTRWSDRYVANILRGNQPLRPKLAEAARKLGQVIDGQHPLLVQSYRVEVRALGHIAPGAVILSNSQPCTCGLEFVPNVSWRKKCFSCSPPRGWKGD